MTGKPKIPTKLYPKESEPLAYSVVYDLSFAQVEIEKALRSNDPEVISAVVLPDQQTGDYKKRLRDADRQLKKIIKDFSNWEVGAPTKEGKMVVDLPVISQRLSDFYAKYDGFLQPVGAFDAYNTDLLKPDEHGVPPQNVQFYHGVSDLLQSARSGMDILLDKTPMGRAVLAAKAKGVSPLPQTVMTSAEFLTKYETAKANLLATLDGLEKAGIQMDVGEGRPKVEALFKAMDAAIGGLGEQPHSFERQPYDVNAQRNYVKAQMEPIARAFFGVRAMYNESMHRYQTQVFPDTDFVDVKAHFFEGMTQMGAVIKDIERQTKEIGTVPISYQPPAGVEKRPAREI